jgi:chemotaxis protein MotB
MMEDSGLRPGQVVQVRGYADQDLRKPQQPEDASNRRVTLIIQYVKGEQPAVFTSNGSLPPAKVPPATVKDVKPEK